MTAMRGFSNHGVLCFFFFFQAEDGIRDLIVTGVQTCALPICAAGVLHIPANAARAGLREGRRGGEGDEDETEEQPPAELRERWTAAHERVSCKRVCPRYHAPRAVCQVRVSPRRFSPPRFTFYL